MYEFQFVLMGPINNIPALVQIMAWHRPGDKPLPERMMVSLLTHICVTRPQWVNTMGSLPQLLMRWILASSSHQQLWYWLWLNVFVSLGTKLEQPLCSILYEEWFVTHWGWDKMVANLLMTFSYAFSWRKIYKFQIRFHWSLFPRVQLTIFQHWFRLGAGQETSHHLNQWWLVYWCIYSASMS